MSFNLHVAIVTQAEFEINFTSNALPDRFFTQGAYTASDKRLEQKVVRSGQCPPKLLDS